MAKPEDSKDIIKVDPESRFLTIFALPINAKASFEIAVDRANAEARIKIIEADIIVKYGLLHKKP